MQSLKYLKHFQPDVVIGTGGYVSGPVLFAASLLGIPIAIQEQNVSPGLTNSILARRAKQRTLHYHRYPTISETHCGGNR